MTRFSRAALAMVLLATGWLPAAELARRPVENFKLPDYRGKVHSLDEQAQHPLIVVAFLGTECPLAKLYGPRLARLAKEFEPQGVRFFGVNANSQDSLAEIAAYARLHQIEFPILKDLGNRLTDQLGATRTPEVFVLDAQRVVRYQGRIDDQYGVGYLRDEPKESFLRAALEDLLAKRPVQTAQTEPVGCFIGRSLENKGPADVTYYQHIAPILQKRCVECHREGQIGPFALTNYDDAASWAETLAEAVEQERMPPWHASPQFGHFENDRRMPAEERNLLLDWVAAGAPAGTERKLPARTDLVEGWQLPRTPDVVIPITEQPYQVPAEGVVKYQYFRVDPRFTEDKWISGAQLLPGNRAVVHHILVFAIPRGNLREIGDQLEGGRRGFLVGYVPGQIARPFPPGMAKRLPAGSQLLFQVHYTPTGTAQQDQSQLGLLFMDPAEVTHEVRTMSAAARRLEIPPGAPNHPVSASSWKKLDESLLLTMMPHMHLRGKSFRYEAEYPDGRRETLLEVPRYDFNWQTAYRLAEPKTMPAGTQIHCTAHYDNSERNLSNPDPTRTVRWGDQTWDEMMIGYFDVAIPIQVARQNPDEEEPMEVAAGDRLRIQAVIRRLDKNGDGKLARDEVPQRLERVFERLDADRNQALEAQELVPILPFLPNES